MLLGNFSIFLIVLIDPSTDFSIRAPFTITWTGISNALEILTARADAFFAATLTAFLSSNADNLFDNLVALLIQLPPSPNLDNFPVICNIPVLYSFVPKFSQFIREIKNPFPKVPCQTKTLKK